MKKIDENSTVADVLEIEGAAEILAKNQFPCVTCPMAQMEMDSLKLGQVCNMYGLDCKKLLKDLEKIQKDSKKNK
jgi:hypothetical protein